MTSAHFSSHSHYSATISTNLQLLYLVSLSLPLSSSINILPSIFFFLTWKILLQSRRLNLSPLILYSLLWLFLVGSGYPLGVPLEPRVDPQLSTSHTATPLPALLSTSLLSSELSLEKNYILLTFTSLVQNSANRKCSRNVYGKNQLVIHDSVTYSDF